MKYDTSLVWFRRDLRAQDHCALCKALEQSGRVFCAFVFDTAILDQLPARADRRVEFIWLSAQALNEDLRASGGGLALLHGKASEEIVAFAAAIGADAVFANTDYEPAAVERDAAVGQALRGLSIDFVGCKDQVVFEKDEVLTQDGRPFSVFTPYRNAWQRKLQDLHVQAYPVDRYASRLAAPRSCPAITLESLGFRRTDLAALGVVPGAAGAHALLEAFSERIEQYHETRDLPAVKGPSYLSVHLRFGTLSIRAAARAALASPSRGAQVWLSELIWRDFYFMILHHHPRVVDGPFRAEYDALAFPNDSARFEAWREARTGYPLIDAAMRQLNRTGYMHNRLRMVTASFLVKDLHVDWRWGERYFAERLIDFDLAANNGGWQWAASTGCDAQPYFRIFNPVTQSRRFDASGSFIRKYLPELAGCGDRAIHAPWEMSDPQQRAAGVIVGRDYPAPLVDHAAARLVTLDLYRRARALSAARTPA